MLEKVKKYKSYIIVSSIVLLIILVYILKQTTGIQIDDCSDPDCLDHEHGIIEQTKQTDENKQTETTDVPETKMYKVYNFSSQLCTYCDMMDPIYNKIKAEYSDKLSFEYVDVNENYTLPNKYKIMYTPTFIVVDNKGEIVDKKVGYIVYFLLWV